MLVRAGISPECPDGEESTSKLTGVLAGFGSLWAVGQRARLRTGCQAKPAVSSGPCGPPHRTVHSWQLASEPKESLLVRTLQP